MNNLFKLGYRVCIICIKYRLNQGGFIMFTERAALQNRLFSLDEKERVLMKELNKERNEIYDRLRELDFRNSLSNHEGTLGEPVPLSEIQASEEEQQVPSVSQKEEIKEPVKEEVAATEEPVLEAAEEEESKAPVLKTADAKEYIIDILKDAEEPINIKQIREKLENYDVEVNNLSNTMWYLSKKTKFVNNPSRGLYEYNKYAKVDNEEAQNTIQ
jgi:hypothetical protein